MIKKKLAQVIRIITIPPIVVSLLIVGLYYLGIIHDFKEAIFLFLFLGLIPLLAYPISYLKPFKGKGREGQRKIAFLFSLLSYSGGILYAFISKSSLNIKIIYLSYFISIINLVFFNAILKVRASGHISSISGPLVSLLYFMGLKSLIPILFLYTLVFWSSLYLNRHTKKEMILATIIVIVSFGLSVLLL